jgi:hypothetical protein
MLATMKYKLIIVTPFFMLLAHYLAVLPHEYAHSLMAWCLGYKTNPWALNYGGTSWLNLLLLFHIDENVKYNLIIAKGQLHHMALIAFAGPGIANGFLYVASLYLLTRKKIQRNRLLYYFIFWFNFMNLANFYDYVPIRTFASHGDIAHISQGLNISPWVIYIVFGYIVGYVIWHFFTRTLIKAFVHLKLVPQWLKASLMIVTAVPLFGYFGMAGFIGYGVISHFLSATSLILIPGVIAACWPTRAWVRRQLQIVS